jgi:hypothetical protein
MFKTNLAPIQSFGLLFPFRDNLFVVYLSVPLGLVGNAVDKEEYASLPNGHEPMVPACHRREELCLFEHCIMTPVIIR